MGDQFLSTEDDQQHNKEHLIGDIADWCINMDEDDREKLFLKQMTMLVLF